MGFRVVGTRIKKVKVVNGKVASIVDVTKYVNNNKEIIQGHYGSSPFSFRKSFHKPRCNTPWFKNSKPTVNIKPTKRRATRKRR